MEDKKEKGIPASSIKIKIENREFTLKFPNTGQFIDLEKAKVRYAEGYAMELSQTGNGFYARILIDAIATFSVLIPELVKEINLNSIFETDILFSKKLVKIYRDEVMPWYKEWTDLLTDIED